MLPKYIGGTTLLKQWTVQKLSNVDWTHVVLLDGATKNFLIAFIALRLFEKFSVHFEGWERLLWFHWTATFCKTGSGGTFEFDRKYGFGT